jgi:hypothetical protein
LATLNVGLLVESSLGVLSAPLAGSLGLHLSQALATVVTVNVLHILEGNAGNEARRLPGLADLAVKLVDLLERQTLGLVDHSPDEEGADETESTPDEEDLGSEVGVAGARVDHVGCGITDGEIQKPVGGCGHRERLGADLEGEELAGNNPGDWAPRAGEEEDVDADECDQRLLGRLVVDTGNGSSDCNDELANGHTNGTEEQEVAATPLLNEVETGKGGSDVDTGCDHGNDEGVAETSVLEERSTVVNCCIISYDRQLFTNNTTYR